MKDTSGPAFPQVIAYTPDGELRCSYDVPDGGGLSIRQWYAGQALAGLLASPKLIVKDTAVIASEAFVIADAMLAREQAEQEPT